MASSTRLSIVAARAVSAALRTGTGTGADTTASFSRYFSTSSHTRSSWPVGASDDADEPHQSQSQRSASAARPTGVSASGSSSLPSTSGSAPTAHRTRAGPILERVPPTAAAPQTQPAEEATSSVSNSSSSSSSSSASHGILSSAASTLANAAAAAALSTRSNRPPEAPNKAARELAGAQGHRSQRPSSSSSSSSSPGAPAARRLPPAPRQKTIMYLDKMKEVGTPIAALTAYDYPTALALRAADIDICLVGDSLANVALGFSTTQMLLLPALLHHAQAVQRALRASTLLATGGPPVPLVVADMPFGTFQTSLEEGVRAAVRLIQEGGVDGVKIEGGVEVVPLVQRLTSFGIPVMGHVGLQPQRVGATSGYRVQGRSAGSAHAIWKSAKAIQDAGAFAIVLECVPSPVARVLTRTLRIPTIGIGAGPDCDGQILVTSDMLGELTSPAHVVAGLRGDHEGDHELATLAGVAHAGLGTSTSAAAAGGIVPITAPPPEDDPTSPSTSPASQQHNHLPLPHPSTPTPPKFVRQFTRAGTTLGAMRIQAVRDYVRAVRERAFPAEGVETYGMKDEAFRSFEEAVRRDVEEEEEEEEEEGEGRRGEGRGF
ncbi:hypothetical protein A4X03_0g8157 [Tilletia caries]|uniref:3-methyl-2-oxobutanoate hydroxymethyltransferase n=1 Tax=Tilletia caries TaxID=13290 RepID=A0A8T8SJF5_9BASI|nr:hypothetical protein A4X03_0g8157 [Tilletia caries]